MKKILVLSLIALLAPAMVFAADPAASAGAKSGSTVLGGLSSGTVAAGTLGVAFVGALVLSNGGDGGSSSGGSNELPAGLQASLDSLYSSLSTAQDARLDYVLVQAASAQQVADVLNSVQAAVAAGATKAQIDQVFADVSAGKAVYSIAALNTLYAHVQSLRVYSVQTYSIMVDFVTALNTTQLTQLSTVIGQISSTGVGFDGVATVIQDGGNVVTPTPVHTPSVHVTPTHH